jgi:hypothetical protein
MVDIVGNPTCLCFDEAGEPIRPVSHIVSIQVPFVFDASCAVPTSCVRSDGIGLRQRRTG